MHKFGLLFLTIIVLFAEPYIKGSLLKAVEKKYGKFAKNRFILLDKELEVLRGKSDFKKLEGVNDFYNNTPYLSDIKNYGRKDYWATPWELLGRDKGDCEDYVIAKYFALKHLGVSTKKLYFSYVKSLKYRQAHMVLTYFKTPKSIPLVLDNYNLKIFPADKRRDLIPVYNFNGDSLYLAKKKGRQGKAVKSDRTHKKWDILVNNIKRNKL
ncbi:MAG: transglutaminase-like cysteine peptidase [Campylobacterota bacterium]|nr:transglutaminase-like cysteine peptidase [Campylobacterota bacterium]